MRAAGGTEGPVTTFALSHPRQLGLFLLPLLSGFLPLADRGEQRPSFDEPLHRDAVMIGEVGGGLENHLS